MGEKLLENLRKRGIEMTNTNINDDKGRDDGNDDNDDDQVQ